MAWLVENRGVNRIKGAAAGGGLAWLLGVPSLLSLNLWSDYTLFGKGFFDLMDYTTANVMLPLGGLLIAVFAGWKLARAASEKELALAPGPIYGGWRFLTRYVVPVAIVLVMLNVTGVLGLLAGMGG